MRSIHKTSVLGQDKIGEFEKNLGHYGNFMSLALGKGWRRYLCAATEGWSEATEPVIVHGSIYDIVNLEYINLKKKDLPNFDAPGNVASPPSQNTNLHHHLRPSAHSSPTHSPTREHSRVRVALRSKPRIQSITSISFLPFCRPFGWAGTFFVGAEPAANPSVACFVGNERTSAVGPDGRRQGSIIAEPPCTVIEPAFIIAGG